MSNPLNYLGIAKKAGAIETGELNSGSAVRSGKAKLLVLAQDASENARGRAEGFIHGGNTPLVILPYTKEQIAIATGEHGCSMAALTDIGLAAVFMSALAEEEPSVRETAELLTQKSEKAKRRKCEAQAHKRNMKTGKTGNSVKPGKRRKNI